MDSFYSYFVKDAALGILLHSKQPYMLGIVRRIGTFSEREAKKQVETAIRHGP